MTTSHTLMAFARQLRALDEAAWQRIDQRLPALRGQSAQALVARAQVSAQGLPSALPAPFRWLMGLTGAVAAEFPSRPGAVPTSEQIATSDLTADQKQNATEAAALTTFLEARRSAYPGAVAVIEAMIPGLIAPNIVVREDWMTLYAALEPEIPLQSVRPPTE